MFRNDPFREFDRFLGANLGATALAGPVPTDVIRFDDRFELHVDLPGVDPSSIDLTVEARELTLTAERSNVLPDDATVVRRSRPSGTISRTFRLGERVDTAAIRADYDNGVLVVSVPVAEAAKARKVEIGAGTAAADPELEPLADAA